MARPTERRLSIGKWQPDRGDIGDEHLLVARNAIPTYRGLLPAQDLVAETSAIGSNGPIGYFSSVGQDGTAYVLAGEKRQLYKKAGASWTSLALTIPSDVDVWHFEGFPAAAYAANGVTYLVKYDISAGTAALLTAGPKPKYLCNVHGYLVAASLHDHEMRVRWSAPDQPENWTVQKGQSGWLDMDATYGGIQGVTGGVPYGLVFQTGAITRIHDIGADGLGEDNRIEGVGTHAPGSVVQFGKLSGCYSQRGFILTDGEEIKNIGANAVDEYFQNNCADLTDLRAAADHEHKRLLWAWKSGEGAAPYDRVLAYHVDTDAWGLVEQPLSWVSEGVTDSKTLDQLDSTIPDINDSDISVDSSQFKGGAQVIHAFNDAYKLASFSGASKDVELQTAQIAPHSHLSALLTGLRPIVKWRGNPGDLAAALTVDVAPFSAPGAPGVPARFDLSPDGGNYRGRRHGKSFRLTLALANDFSEFQEMLCYFTPRGRR